MLAVTCYWFYWFWVKRDQGRVSKWRFVKSGTVFEACESNQPAQLGSLQDNGGSRIFCRSRGRRRGRGEGVLATFLKSSRYFTEGCTNLPQGVQSRFSKVVHMYIHIIIIVTWSGVLYHVEWMRPYHRITRDAKRRGWSIGMASSTRRDTVRQIKLLL